MRLIQLCFPRRIQTRCIAPNINTLAPPATALHRGPFLALVAPWPTALSWRVAAARPGDAGDQGVAVRTAWTTPTPDTSNILAGGGEGAPSARAGRALRWLGGSMLMPGGHTPGWHLHVLDSSVYRSPLIRQLHA